MGGDFGPPVMVPAACEALTRHPNLSILLVGIPELIEAELENLGARYSQQFTDRITIEAASQTILMSEKPSQVLRKKKDSSMAIALKAVAEDRAQACISAGNTGALMAFSRLILKMIPGVARPAITTSIPTDKGHTRLIDLGANVDCSAENLLQFALMGSAMVSAVENNPKPKVGLLHIGSESIKGNEQTRATAELLEQTNQLNYIGFVEADALYRGVSDVIVCDGFVGNVLLKGSEGTARMLSNRLQEELNRNLLTRLLSFIVMPVLESFKKRVNPDQYNGASFIGLQGIVIKSHGGANHLATLAAIEEAIREIEHNVPAIIHEQFKQLAL